MARNGKNPTIDDRIQALVADGKKHTKKEIFDLFPDKSKNTISVSITHMYNLARIDRIRRGVYVKMPKKYLV